MSDNRPDGNAELDIEKLARSRWGTDAQYFQELERFLKEHRGSSFIEYHNETKMPVMACYIFQPYQVFIEHEQLMKALRDSDKEKP
jgi:hypothetical protein